MRSKPRVQGKTAVVTVVSDETGFRIRQASRGGRRDGLVMVDGSARFVHTVPYQTGNSTGFVDVPDETVTAPAVTVSGVQPPS